MKVTTLTLGTMTFGGVDRFSKVGSSGVKEVGEIISMCIDHGVNLLDTANIYSFGRSEVIVTSIIQTLGKGEVIVGGTKIGRGIQSLHNPNWVLHDSIGYVLPGEKAVNIKVDIQKGNLQRIYGLGKDSVYASEV